MSIFLIIITFNHALLYSRLSFSLFHSLYLTMIHMKFIYNIVIQCSTHYIDKNSTLCTITKWHIIVLWVHGASYDLNKFEFEYIIDVSGAAWICSVPLAPSDSTNQSLNSASFPITSVSESSSLWQESTKYISYASDALLYLHASKCNSHFSRGNVLAFNRFQCRTVDKGN